MLNVTQLTTNIDIKQIWEDGNSGNGTADGFFQTFSFDTAVSGATVLGDASDNVLQASDNGDQLAGFSGADAITGGAGDDILVGADGDDLIIGGAGHDYINGGSDNDTLSGGGNDDVIYGGSGVDTLNGGDGDDDLFGGDEIDTLNGDAGEDLLIGGKGDDILHGGADDDTLFGGDDDDALNGDAGDDILYGEYGQDTLSGGTGDNILYGGLSNDTAYEVADSVGYTIFKADNKINISYVTNGVASNDLLQSIETLTLEDASTQLTTNIDIKQIWDDLGSEQNQFADEADFLSWLGNDAGYNYNGL